MADNRRAQGKHRYAAFVSYSHADEEIARWLHKRLETYKAPRGLGAKRPSRRLGKVFRDRVELASSHDLGGDIRTALDRSDALILLCSPRSARSPYVAEEIRRFKATGKTNRIFAAILDGEPHAAGKPGRSPDEECFPRALLYRLEPDGSIGNEPEPAEPIAADLRAGKDGRENGALKLIAGLLGVTFDDIWQRERRRQRVRVAVTAGFLTLGIALSATAGVASWLAIEFRAAAERNSLEAAANLATARAKEVEAQRNLAEAERQRAIAADMSAQAQANLQEANLQRGFAAENLSEAERQAAVAARRLSNQRALAARDLDSQSDGGLGDYRTAVLMALYADPAAEASDAYAPARAVLVSASLKLEFSKTSQNDRIVNSLATLQGHDESVQSAVFSPDGLRVLTSSLSDARLWDARTGKALLALKRTGGFVRSARFSPSGLQVITAGSGGVLVWDANSGNHLLNIAPPSGAWFNSAIYSPNGRRIVTASENGTTDVWDAATGKRQLSLRGAGGAVHHAAFSADGRQIVTATFDGMVEIWDAASGDRLQTIKAHSLRARFAAFSDDGKRIITTSWDDGEIRIWNAATGQAEAALRNGFTSAMAAFTGNGSHVAAASGKNVQVWNAKAASLELIFPAHDALITTAAFSPDSRYVVTASTDKTARIWPLPDLIHAPAARQVQFACNLLKETNSPLAFSIAEKAKYPVLQTIGEDPDRPGFFVSPCRGVLPEAAFAKAR